ncbi:hypothetical protein [Oxynema sp. CENA135]|nr:hypothetical protein [Oxynema sp. CENA135]
MELWSYTQLKLKATPRRQPSPPNTPTETPPSWQMVAVALFNRVG